MWFIHLGRLEACRVEGSRGPRPPRAWLREGLWSPGKENPAFLQGRALCCHRYPRWEEEEDRLERREEGEVTCVLYGSVGGIMSQGGLRSVVLLECGC